MAALRKLHAIRNKIGYPDQWRDYSALTIAPGDYFGNIRRATIFEDERQWHKLGKPVDRNEWGMSAADGERLLRSADERHQLPRRRPPAAALRPQARRRAQLRQHRRHHRPRADARLRRRGPAVRRQGQPRRLVDPRRTPKGFEDRINCVRDQYAGYVIVDDIHINSKLTSGEDVADLGGTLLAYIAWKEQTAASSSATVDGFTPDQRFFVGMAQWACENERA